MNFKDKIETESKTDRLAFLTNYEFEPNERCGYGCCIGYFRGLHSSNGLDFNRLTVFIKNDSIHAVNHNEYDVGGHNYNTNNSINLSEATDDDILEMINDTLPNDLD